LINRCGKISRLIVDKSIIGDSTITKINNQI